MQKSCRGETGVPGEKPFGAEKRTNKLNPHMTQRLGLNPDHIGGRRVLSPMCHACSLNDWIKSAVGTLGLRDSGTHLRSIVFQKWENIPKKVELLMLFCKNNHLCAFQVQAKHTAKFKNWILEKSFSPPVTELDCETKQET